MVKLSVKLRAKDLLQSGSADVELEADTIEDIEKLLKMTKENFKFEY